MSLDELTDHMVSKAKNDYRTAVCLMLDCLSIIPFQLHHLAIVGIDVAQRFWRNGAASRTELEKARVDCWNHLDACSASTNTEEPEYSAIRAVITTMYADPPSDDLADVVQFFNEMLLRTLHEDNNLFSDKVCSVVDNFKAEENQCGRSD